MDFTGRVGGVLALALLLLGTDAAPAGWTQAAPTCFRKKCARPITTYHYSMSYDPSTCTFKPSVQQVTTYRVRRIGPIRRFFRRLFGIPCCPPPAAAGCCPPTAGAQVPPALSVAPGATGPGTVPPPPAPPEDTLPGTPAPGDFNRVVPPGAAPPPAPFPSETSPTRRAVPSRKPTPPIPLDRLASTRLPSRQPGESPEAKRLDRANPRNKGMVVGQVVRTDRSPYTRAELLLVYVGRQPERQMLTSDGRGQFRVTLTEGRWLLYLRNDKGQPIFHEQLEVRAQKTVTVQVKVRSR